MKLLALLSTLSLFTIANAQTIEIDSPTAGTILTRGKKMTIQIDRPNSIEGCQEVGIAIGIINCATASSCPSPSAEVGDVLYAGPFTPTAHQGQYYETFTATVPTTMTAGAGQLNLVHLCLLGAGPSPLLEYRTVAVKIK